MKVLNQSLVNTKTIDPGSGVEAGPADPVVLAESELALAVLYSSQPTYAAAVEIAHCA